MWLYLSIQCFSMAILFLFYSTKLTKLFFYGYATHCPLLKIIKLLFYLQKKKKIYKLCTEIIKFYCEIIMSHRTGFIEKKLWPTANYGAY